MNPPYGPQTYRWLSKLADHGDGFALIFARTETAGFFAQGWERADSMLFLRGRLTFYRVDGTKGSGNSGGPSVILAYGSKASEKLRTSGIDGAFVPSWSLVGGTPRLG